MDRFAQFIRQRERSGNLRILEPLQRLPQGLVMPVNARSPAPSLDFSSNDYLALSQHPAVIAGSRNALEQDGAGAGAARLMSGSLVCHHLLEEELAAFKGTEAALIFGSGYLANIGVIPALAGRGDAIFCDRFNHASIYDGCRLAGAKTFRFRHNDMNHLEELLRKHRASHRRALIVAESIYSMDGDRCPLPEICMLKDRFDSMLMVDEAHATGLFGNTGAGLVEEDGVVEQVDIAMGTFGKALGSYGAYIAASRSIVHYLVNQARSFIYSTALPPAVIGAARAAIKLVKQEPSLRHELYERVAFFKHRLQVGGLDRYLGPSQIIPVLVGDSKKASAIANRLKSELIFAKAVRPPTVPEGSARIRFSITRHHSKEDLERTADRLLEVLSIPPLRNGE
jgi:8-amino-7-oxononanoate synthase